MESKEDQPSDTESKQEQATDESDGSKDTTMYDKTNQTEVDNSNILTVHRIEIVTSMETWGTQTDTNELEAMDPITPTNVQVVNAEVVERKDTFSETESIVSSALRQEEALHKRNEDSTKKTNQGVGLDMRRGEYHEVYFPPVPPTNPQKHVEPVHKECTPSPVDLCTSRDKSPLKKKFKTDTQKLPAACTVSKDP